MLARERFKSGTNIFAQKYSRGYTMKQHFDNQTVFENPILCVTLLGDAELRMSNDAHGGQERGFPLVPGTVYVLSGDARYKWKHGVLHDVTATTGRIALICRVVKEQYIESRRGQGAYFSY